MITREEIEAIQVDANNGEPDYSHEDIGKMCELALLGLQVKEAAVEAREVAKAVRESNILHRLPGGLAIEHKLTIEEATNLIAAHVVGKRAISDSREQVEESVRVIEPSSMPSIESGLLDGLGLSIYRDREVVRIYHGPEVIAKYDEEGSKSRNEDRAQNFLKGYASMARYALDHAPWTQQSNSAESLSDPTKKDVSQPLSTQPEIQPVEGEKGGATDLNGKCKFNRAWIGGCGTACVGDYCQKHATAKCCSCKAQATHDCPESGALVCGAPLCDNCTSIHTPGKLGHRHGSKKNPWISKLKEGG
jgi:hypothetical protein